MNTLICLIILIFMAICVAQVFGGAIAVIFFFASLWPMLKIAMAIDISRAVYNNHHKRNDARAKKIVDSIRVIDRERYERERILEEYRREKAEKNAAYTIK